MNLNEVRYYYIYILVFFYVAIVYFTFWGRKQHFVGFTFLKEGGKEKNLFLTKCSHCVLGDSSYVSESNLPQSRETGIVNSVSQLSNQSRITIFKVIQLMEQKFESRTVLF